MRKWGSRRGWRLILLMLAVSSVAMPKPVQASSIRAIHLGVMRSKGPRGVDRGCARKLGRADPGDIRTLLESVAREFCSMPRFSQRSGVARGTPQ